MQILSQIYQNLFTSFVSLMPGLPAVRPGSTMARAPVAEFFHTIKVIMSDLQNCCSKESLYRML